MTQSSQAPSNNSRAETAAVAQSNEVCTLQVWDGESWHQLSVDRGTNLRDALIQNQLPPHNLINRYLNCRGKGHCAACCVYIDENAPKPRQWLDRFCESSFGNRVSCTLVVNRDMTIRLR